MKVSIGKRVFDVINFILMLGLCATIVFPFIHIFAVSVSNSSYITSMQVGLIPKGFYTKAYEEMVVNRVFVRTFINTVLITIVFAFLSVLICIMSSYAFSRKFYGKKVINYFFIITMYFNGGLIPTYLVVAKYLNLYDTYAALIVPGLVSVFYIIVMRTQIEQIPASLTEAALIDGANQFQVLFNVIIPVVKPTIAAISMFLILGKWNSWFDVLVYIREKNHWTLQYYLREIVFMHELAEESDTLIQVKSTITAQNYKMAAIILVALPVLAVYPFVQKYFVKGMLAGSVKG